MVASSLHFIDLKGKLLLSRDYRGDIPLTHAESFLTILNSKYVNSDDKDKFELMTAPPVISKKGIHYIYIKHKNIYRN